jgi:hypothetical protein
MLEKSKADKLKSMMGTEYQVITDAKNYLRLAKQFNKDLHGEFQHLKLQNFASNLTTQVSLMIIDKHKIEDQELKNYIVAVVAKSLGVLDANK